MLSPGFSSTVPAMGSVPPSFGQPFPSQAAPNYALPPASPPLRPPVVQQQAPAPRVVRGQQPDEPPAPAAPVFRQAPLRMPSPQELGVADAKPENSTLDWTAVHDLLDRLGATCFHLERVGASGYHLTCLLPTDQPSRTHCIEVEAPSEAEAVRLALAKVQQWAGGRQ
jgi:hypothetical protein